MCVDGMVNVQTWYMYMYLGQVKEKVLAGFYSGLRVADLAARGLEVRGVNELTTLITLVTTSILKRK